VIVSFRHKGLKQLYNGKPRGVPAPLRERIRQILALLDRAPSPLGLALPGLRLHELKGELKGTWAVSVSGNWRVTFRFENGSACDVNLEDYH
jgi:proteic killer suppression protein